MTKKEELFFLIRALSKSEKRHFKLFSRRETSEHNYLKLFDAIDKQMRYDESEIKKRFAGEKFIEQLHVTKYYLKQLILQSLRNYHSCISKDAELKDILRNIEILFNKELFRLCKDEIKKARILAERYELMTGLVEVLDWERRLDQAMEPHNYVKFRKTVSEQRRAIDKLENYNAYWKNSIDITGGDQAIVAYNDLPPTLESPGRALTLAAKVLHYNMAYFWMLQKGRDKEAEDQLYILIETFERYPQRLREEPGLYISCINNLVSYLVFTRQYDKALNLIQKLKTIFGDKHALRNKTILKQMLRTFNIEMEIYRDTKTYKAHSGFIEETEALILKYQEKMPDDYLASFRFQLANIHFMKHDFSRSLFWINHMLNTRSRNVRPDLKVQVHILNLMVHLEQKNSFVLRYFVDSTKRFIKKVKKVQPYEEVLLNFFARIGKLPILDHIDAFRSLRDQLFPREGNSLVPEEALGYIDYKEWIENKLK